MRRKDGFKLRVIGDEAVIVPLAQNVVDFHALITLNESGRYLWEQLDTDTSEDALTAGFAKEYAIDPIVARQDVHAFLSDLATHGLVE